MSKAKNQRVSKQNIKGAISGLVSNVSVFIVVLVVWQFSVIVFRIKPYILPSPVEVAKGLVIYWPAMQSHLYTTLTEIILGFGATILISIPAAALISYSKTFEKTIYPFLVLLQLIPKVAIAPLFVVWFGFGTMPKILLVFLLSFFPLLIDATAGFKSLNARLVYVAKTMSDSEWDFFWKIKFPNALPQIFTGLKTSVAFASVGAIVAEFVGSDKGLGYLLLRANGDLNTVMLFALLVVLSVIGIVLYKIIEIVESRVIPWHVSQRKEIVSDSAKL